MHISFQTVRNDSERFIAGISSMYRYMNTSFATGALNNHLVITYHNDGCMYDMVEELRINSKNLPPFLATDASKPKVANTPVALHVAGEMQFFMTCRWPDLTPWIEVSKNEDIASFRSALGFAKLLRELKTYFRLMG